MVPLKVNPQDIVIFHVGGSLDSCGPIDAIINSLPSNCVVVTFEARAEESDQPVKSIRTASGIRWYSVNAFVGEEDGKIQEFRINKHPESSSALPPNPEVFDEIIPVPYSDEIPTWGNNTELERKVLVSTKSMSAVIAEMGLIPDVLSIDAQGFELPILRGCGEKIGQVLALVTEVELFEIYSGQGLYGDQAALLRKSGFRLANFIGGFQEWYPRVVCGRGYLTVAEALWFKRLDAFFLENCGNADFILRGIKFAAIAGCFEFYSVTYLLIERLRSICASDVDSCCQEFGYGIVLDFYDKVKSIDEEARRAWPVPSR